MTSKVLIIIFIVVILVFGAYSFLKQGQENNAPAVTFKMISSEKLTSMLTKKDFELIDVHIPEQKHIPGTDSLIPFNEIDKIVEALPNKDQKVVLYCRSGGMSRQVAEELTSRGYTNIFNLEKGMNQWLAEGRDTLPLGSI